MPSSQPRETFWTPARLHPSLQTTLRLGNPFSQLGREFIFSGCTNDSFDRVQHCSISLRFDTSAFNKLDFNTLSLRLYNLHTNCHDFLVYLVPFCLDSAKSHCCIFGFSLLPVASSLIFGFGERRYSSHQKSIHRRSTIDGVHIFPSVLVPLHHVGLVGLDWKKNRLRFFIFGLDGPLTAVVDPPIRYSGVSHLVSRALSGRNQRACLGVRRRVLYDTICISGANGLGRKRRSRAFMGWYQNCLRQGKVYTRYP